MAVDEELRRKREELVIEHMETENRHQSTRPSRPSIIRATS